ncbi:MAG: hypothetical protein ACE5LL_09305, partial [Alphaproteobacteria bacterium]
DLCSEQAVPMFRHALLLRSPGAVAREQVEGPVALAVDECDRYDPAFQSVIWGGKSPDEALCRALVEPVGEA